MDKYCHLSCCVFFFELLNFEELFPHFGVDQAFLGERVIKKGAGACLRCCGGQTLDGWNVDKST